jgi:alkylation response protein AidB-like acyl-CoA dehydrogenase
MKPLMRGVAAHNNENRILTGSLPGSLWVLLVCGAAWRRRGQAAAAAEVDRTSEFRWDVYEALVESDRHAVHIAEAYGGAGADAPVVIGTGAVRDAGVEIGHGSQ